MDRIEIKNVTKRYTDNKGLIFDAVHEISLDWKSGESIAVIGESGSGKSTLAKIMIGLEKPTKGEVFIDGNDTLKWKASDWRKCRIDLQAVFQDSRGTLNPSRSILSNVEESLYNLTNLSKNERENRIFELMDLMQLDNGLLTIAPQKLSGGEQRRFGLLRALAVKPKFLVLDEVTAGLDLLSINAVLTVLENYKKSFDCNYFVITHDIAVATKLCDRIYEMNRGGIVKGYVKPENN